MGQTNLSLAKCTAQDSRKPCSGWFYLQGAPQRYLKVFLHCFLALCLKVGALCHQEA